MRGLGLLLLKVGAGIALGYGIYRLFRVLFSALSLPGPLKVAVTLAILGALLVLVSLATGRWRRGRRLRLRRFWEMGWWD